MHININSSDAVALADNMGRLDQFGADGWRALFEHIETIEADTGEAIEADIIALCCDFTRYESLAHYNSEYGTDYADVDDIDALACLVGDGPAFICYAH